MTDPGRLKNHAGLLCCSAVSSIPDSAYHDVPVCIIRILPLSPGHLASGPSPARWVHIVVGNQKDAQVPLGGPGEAAAQRLSRLGAGRPMAIPSRILCKTQIARRPPPFRSIFHSCYFNSDDRYVDSRDVRCSQLCSPAENQATSGHLHWPSFAL